MLQTLLGRKKYEEGMSDGQPLRKSKWGFHVNLTGLKKDMYVCDYPTVSAKKVPTLKSFSQQLFVFFY